MHACSVMNTIIIAITTHAIYTIILMHQKFICEFTCMDISSYRMDRNYIQGSYTYNTWQEHPIRKLPAKGCSELQETPGKDQTEHLLPALSIILQYDHNYYHAYDKMQFTRLVGAIVFSRYNYIAVQHGLILVCCTYIAQLAVLMCPHYQRLSRYNAFNQGLQSLDFLVSVLGST